MSIRAGLAALGVLADPPVLRWVALDDQPRLAQDAQVPAHRRGGNVESRVKLGRAPRPLRQQLEDVGARRVGERGKQSTAARPFYQLR
jgi:hypothetical protein